MKKEINDFLKGKKFNFNEFLGKIDYFIGNFWPAIVVILLIIILISIKLNFNKNFNTDKITNVIKNSKYGGNAVIVNKNYFLTTYDTINDFCKSERVDQKINFYLVTNDGSYYSAKVYAKDNTNNLAILKVEANIMNKGLANNYIVFPAKYDTLLNSNVFISKTKNTEQSHFYEKNKIAGLSDVGFYIKRNNFRNNIGESVLNDRLEFVGLTTGNSKLSKYKFFLNEVDIVNQNKIESFLKQNRIFYYKNMNNLDLIKYSNYIKNMNVKVVCTVKNVRVPLILKTKK